MVLYERMHNVIFVVIFITNNINIIVINIEIIITRPLGWSCIYLYLYIYIYNVILNICYNFVSYIRI